MAAEFRRFCQHAAERIRAGALRKEEGVSQVRARSFEPLAKLNERGLASCDSQDGQANERAYVVGFCQHAAERIRAGALREEEGVSQVRARSFEPLAKLNERGLASCDSQDGQANERAYVVGFCTPQLAYALMRELNCSSDKVLIVIRTCEEAKRSFIPLTRDARTGIDETRQHLYDTRDVHAWERASIGLRPSAFNDALLTVIAFDPVWGRRAYSKRGGLWGDLLAAMERARGARERAELSRTQTHAFRNGGARSAGKNMLGIIKKPTSRNNRKWEEV